jgi:hypothetical protein
MKMVDLSHLRRRRTENQEYDALFTKAAKLPNGKAFRLDVPRGKTPYVYYISVRQALRRTKRKLKCARRLRVVICNQAVYLTKARPR